MHLIKAVSMSVAVKIALQTTCSLYRLTTLKKEISKRMIEKRF